jgi:hypothetical protein
MYDGSKIIPGLVVFLLIVISPVLYNLGNASYEPPELAKPAKGEECIEPTEWIRANHMQLLDEWRDWVVRDKERVYVASTGESHTISLQNTCMDCHDKKAEFCDRCHDEASVSPYCWDCHIAPEGLSPVEPTEETGESGHEESAH